MHLFTLNFENGKYQNIKNQPTALFELYTLLINQLEESSFAECQTDLLTATAAAERSGLEDLDMVGRADTHAAEEDRSVAAAACMNDE